jgi:hypothetical protein
MVDGVYNYQMRLKNKGNRSSYSPLAPPTRNLSIFKKTLNVQNEGTVGLTLMIVMMMIDLLVMARGKLINTERKSRSALSDVVSREYTIHLHTRVHGVGFKHVRFSYSVVINIMVD